MTELLRGYKGTRDFYPDDQRLRTWLYGCLRRTLEGYGYEEYGGPFLEPLALYLNKTSREIVETQLYLVRDRGNRELAVRPEMTPTLARMVAARGPELPKPLRWYSIPTCMRAENPQRGRLREFDQLNVDVLGGSALDEDVEILLVALSLLEALGATPEDYTVRVNHRGVLSQFLRGPLGLPEDQEQALCRILDKRDKLPPEVFHREALLTGPVSMDALNQFLSSGPEALASMVPGEAATALKDALSALAEVHPGRVVFDPGLVRGFDYYTGLVFEVFDTHPDNRRALFGGGRYDNLVGSMGGVPLGGTGFGVSDVALLNFLESHGRTPQIRRRVDCAVLRFDEGDRTRALLLARDLRAAGLHVVTPLSAQKFAKQLSLAQRDRATAVVFPEAAGGFSVKHLASGKQKTWRQEDLPQAAAELLAAR